MCFFLFPAWFVREKGGFVEIVKRSDFPHMLREEPERRIVTTTTHTYMEDKINGVTPKTTVHMNNHLETRNADRRVWLMKCPTVVSRFFEQYQHSSSSSTPLSSSDNDLSFVSPKSVAKVTVVIDPLLANDATQVFIIYSRKPWQCLMKWIEELGQGESCYNLFACQS